MYIQDELELCKSPEIKMPQSPTTHPIDQVLPRPHHNQNTSNIPSDYSGSTPTSEQFRENPFNPPATTEHLPYWKTQVFTQIEPNLVNDLIDV